MSREPIRWNRDALETLQEIGTGILALVAFPLSIIIAITALTTP